MSTIKKCTMETFHKDVIESSMPVLIDFYADWCAPCRKMMPIVEQFAQEYLDALKVYKINIDSSPELASKFEIMTIPTFIIFKDGKLKAKHVASLPKNELKFFIDKNL